MSYPDWIYRKANVRIKRRQFITKVSIEDIEYQGRWYHKRLWCPTETRLRQAVADARTGMVMVKQRELDMYWNRGEAA